MSLKNIVLNYSSMLNPETKSNLDSLLKNKDISQTKKGIILYKNKPILWDELKSDFKKKKINEKTMRAIGGLRKCTLKYLLHTLKIKNLNCYTEIGSDTPTSDLDFTYVSYKNPSNVVPRMIKFYSQFYTMYGHFPDKTFDTNYYITALLLQKQCFEKTREDLKKYFTKLSDNLYALNNYKNSSFHKLDNRVCFQIQKQQLNFINQKHHESKLEKLVQYALLFYMIVDDKSVKKTDDKILLLRTLAFFMCMYSNEAYISDKTLQIILFHLQMKNEDDKCIAFVDQYLFMYEWYTMYKDRKNDVLQFFDVVSKYIYRSGICLAQSKFLSLIPKSILHYAEFWTKNVRGKISFQEANSLPETKEILKEIKSIDYLINIFTKLYKKVAFKLENKEAKEYVQNVDLETLISVKIQKEKFIIDK